METVAGASDLDIGALFGRGAGEAGIPGQRDRDRASVIKLDDEVILGHAHARDAVGISFPLQDKSPRPARGTPRSSLPYLL